MTHNPSPRCSLPSSLARSSSAPPVTATERTLYPRARLCPQPRDSQKMLRALAAPSVVLVDLRRPRECCLSSCWWSVGGRPHCLLPSPWCGVVMMQPFFLLPEIMTWPHLCTASHELRAGPPVALPLCLSPDCLQRSCASLHSAEPAPLNPHGVSLV